ncbi:MAG: DUF1329 domain-containing protein [Pseudomonas sp.]
MRTQQTVQAIVTTMALLATGFAWSAVSPEEAAKLQKELTPLGGEKAGNKDGTIPEWTGGYSTPPAGYKPGTPRPDPFSGDKKLFSITAANMAEYSSKLSDGQQALLKKYPTYRIDVYPTRRTASAPEYIYDNTLKNATRAKLAQEGNMVEGAYGGVPFPIPQNASEVMWNHQLRWLGESTNYNASTYVVSGGEPVLAAKTRMEVALPYAYKDGTLETFKGDIWLLYQVATDPSYKAGETILIRDPVDYVGRGRQAWQYLVGQRRVRKAPSIGYDTPNTVTSGSDFFDEAALFNGAPDKYSWKLIGKKEMYIPYNVNGFFLQPADQALSPNHLNPDHVRWELHRVWEVEADLLPGKRHVIPKKKFYVDEDTWNAVLYDGWDKQGQLWHSGESLPFLAYEFPGVFSQPFAMFDLLKGSYSATVFNGQPNNHWAPAPRFPDSNFTPDSMAARGVR